MDIPVGPGHHPDPFPLSRPTPMAGQLGRPPGTPRALPVGPRVRPGAKGVACVRPACRPAGCTPVQRLGVPKFT